MTSSVHDFKERTKQFTLRIIRLIGSLPRSKETDVIGYQLMKSGSSVGANYRAACRARSRKEFEAKLGIVEEESDESTYWLEILVDSGIVPEEKLIDLIQESEEITAMVVASIRTSRLHGKQGKPFKR